jgi:L-lactate dehydrogenase
MNNLNPKVSVIGCGNVGLRYAYGMLIKGTARALVLVDIDKERIKGEVSDISHGIPYGFPVKITAGDYPDIKNSDLVVITAGKKQKEGQSRMELAGENVKLFKKIIPDIVKFAPDAKILVVTNPVDVMSFAAYKFSGKPAREVIGSGTVLDSARFKFLLAEHCSIDARNIHAYVLGEHGDSEFPMWSRAMVGGVFFNEYCQHICTKRYKCRKEEEHDKIFQQVRGSAYEIIRRKGETSYGIGLAMVRITQAILNNQMAVLPVSSYIKGLFGLKECYISLPAVVGKEGVREIIYSQPDKKEEEQLNNSVAAIRETLKHTGLI